jgi:hypothetical protein
MLMLKYCEIKYYSFAENTAETAQQNRVLAMVAGKILRFFFF